MSTTTKPSIAKRISALFATNKPAASIPQKEPTSSTTLVEGTLSDDSYEKIDHPINPSPPTSPPKKHFFSTKKKEAVSVDVVKGSDQVESSSRTYESPPLKKSFGKRVSSFFKFGQPAPISTAAVPPVTTAPANTVIPEIIVQSPCDQGITVDFNNLGHGGEDDEEQRVSSLKKVSMELEGAEVGGVFIQSFDVVKKVEKKADPVVEESKKESKKEVEEVKKEEVVEKEAEPVIEKEDVADKEAAPVVDAPVTVAKEEAVEKKAEPVNENEDVVVDNKDAPVVDAPVIAKIEEKSNGTTIGDPSTPVVASTSNASKNKKKNNKKKNKNKK